MPTKFEKLLDEANDQNISVDENYPFQGKTLGLYVDQNIALSDKLHTSAEKSCVMAEELGHHYTSVGNIVDLSYSDNAKQERKARLWAYNKQIGLNGLIEAYDHGCRGCHEIAEFLEVTDEFVTEAVSCYEKKYGIYTEHNGRCIMFVPYLAIGKLL